MMTSDVKELLALAVPDPAVLHASGAAPADLARGQRMLRRRRLTVVGAGAVVVGMVAGGLATSTPSGHAPVASRPPRPPASAPASPAGQPGASGHSIALVDYTGTQIPGYQVAKVPAGWTIQGGNAYVLALAPAGDPDTDIDSFAGKLVVTLESASDAPSQLGAAETVKGQPGRFWTEAGTQILIYRYTASTWVDIQAPSTLGWDSAQLVAFADGVKVLGNAQQSHG
jgi:hypothetical protein